MEKELRKILYRDGDLLLEQSGEKIYITLGEQSYQITDYPYEPYLYIKMGHGFFVTIHNSFSLQELCLAAKENGSIKMITGDEYDMQGICMLLRKALALSMESVDISYLEECCFTDHLKECGAVSEETAVSLSDWGIKNPNVMNTFLHAKKVKRTNDARYYIPQSHNKDIKNREEDTGRFFRVISNQVRFGCGYRKENGKMQYFAWHGYPNRNDDYITTTEITSDEFEDINKEYPKEIIADREAAELFRNKYIEGHTVILEGWNKLL